MIITISLDIKKSVEICENLWTKKSEEMKSVIIQPYFFICGNLWIKECLTIIIMEDKCMTQENKARLIKFLWNLASAVLVAIGTALGVSCAVA